MDYFLSEEQIMTRDLARQIAEEKVVPVRRELDEKEEFPWEIMKALAQSDLFSLFIPEEYGGLGKGTLELCITIEELSKACLGVSTTYAANALGTYPVLLLERMNRKRNISLILPQANDWWPSVLLRRMPEAMQQVFRQPQSSMGMNMSLTAPNSG